MTAPAFAEYIRTLGRGPSRSRSLTLEEADAAMTMIHSGMAQPIQVGALLVLLRYRGETAPELAGMARSLRATVPARSAGAGPDLDWPSYAAGRSRGLPWFALSALLLAANGVRVFMHSHNSHQSHPVALDRALAAFGIAPSLAIDDAAGRLERDHLAHMPLSAVCPRLLELLELRTLLGVRSAANTIARMLNPLGAAHLIQGVFHPPYRDLQREAARLLGQPRLAVFKGGGGEAERPANKTVEVFTLDHDQIATDAWPAPLGEDARRGGDEVLETAPMLALWRGGHADAHATALVTGSAAIALRLLGRAASVAEADEMAVEWWERRERGRF